MSRELTLIEKMGVEFEERDGLFYPLGDNNYSDVFGDGAGANECVKAKDIGKYGHLWINYMQEAYPERYRSLVRFGLLEEKSVAVNEEAYEMLCVMEEKLLKLDVCKGASFAEKYASTYFYVIISDGEKFIFSNYLNLGIISKSKLVYCRGNGSHGERFC